MSKNPLTSVQRPDKNGKVVTRHVRPDTAPKGAPEVLKQVGVHLAQRTNKQRLIDDIGELLYDGSNEITLDSFDEGTLKQLQDIAVSNLGNGDQRVARENERTLISVLNPKQSRPMDMTSSETDYLPIVVKEIDGLAKCNRLDKGTRLVDTLNAVRGLWAYEFQQEQDEAPLDEKTTRALVDSIGTAYEVLDEFPDGFEDVFDDGENGVCDYPDNIDNYFSFLGGDHEGMSSGELWIRNDRFVDLIKRRVDETEKIFDIMRSRKTLQPETVEAVLDADVHDSLTGGVL